MQIHRRAEDRVGDLVNLRLWELNILMLESTLAGVLLATGTMLFLARALHAPDPVTFPLGALVLGWTLFPVQRITARTQGRTTSAARFAAWSVAGAVVAGLVVWLTRFL
jgi:hypothetical protein